MLNPIGEFMQGLAIGDNDFAAGDPGPNPTCAASPVLEKLTAEERLDPLAISRGKLPIGFKQITRDQPIPAPRIVLRGIPGVARRLNLGPTLLILRVPFPTVSAPRRIGFPRDSRRAAISTQGFHA